MLHYNILKVKILISHLQMAFSMLLYLIKGRNNVDNISEKILNEEFLDEEVDEAIDWDWLIKENQKDRLERIKTLKPMALISVYIDEDGKIEDYYFISQFVGGDYGDRLGHGSDEYDKYILESSGVYDVCTEKDALYHLYINIEYYKSVTWECEEWDSELTILNAILVQTNYRQFLEAEEDRLEQRKLAVNDDNAYISIRDSDDTGCYGSNMINLTHNDALGLIRRVAELDVRLAHRIGYNFNLGEILGESYDPNIEKIEKKRNEFKKYIKKSKDFRYNENGYQVKNIKRSWNDKTVDVSFEDIDNLSDEDLLTKDPEMLLIQLYYAQEMMNKLMDGVEEIE